MKRKSTSKERVLACRVTDKELYAVEDAAKAVGLKNASAFTREAVLEKLNRNETRSAVVVPPGSIKEREWADPDPEPIRSRSWAQEWVAIEKLSDSRSKIERFNELRDGRDLPDGFGTWPKAQRVVWLDREWPL